MPASLHALFQQVLALRSAGHNAKAVAVLLQAAASHPSNPELQHQLGNALRRVGRLPESRTALKKAVRLAPANPTYRLNLGVSLLELEAYAEAVPHFEKALDLTEPSAEALNILAVALLNLGRLAEARSRLEQALNLRPDHAPALDNLARAYKAQGRITEAIPCYRAALKAAPSSATHSNLLLALNFVPGLSQEELSAEHRAFETAFCPPQAPLSQPAFAPKHPPIERRVRIGYISPDFCHHAVSFFIEPVLSRHDHSRFEVFCYDNGVLPDATTSRLQQFVDHWRTITSLSDSEVTSLIRRDSLDILVDLAGHTARNRLLVFPARPAALQLSWLGYPNTTGLSSIDLRVTDSTCVPLGSEAELGAEAVLRIDPFFSVYQPPAEIPEIDARKSATGSIRFCSFNNLAKLSEPTLTLWAEILKEIPDSCMLLKSPGAEDTETQSLIRARFEAASISPSRIRFDGRRLRMKDHLCLYNTCDIALDPFPYNGTTTTCEALLMSLPVVALAGKSHASRVGTSLLYAIGLPELIAESSADYLKIAVGLARDSNRLLMLRSSVRQRFIKSPICDAVAFTAKWEASLLLELERRGLHFAVDRT